MAAARRRDKSPRAIAAAGALLLATPLLLLPVALLVADQANRVRATRYAGVCSSWWVANTG